jgi:hypothetical protein
MLSKAEVQYLQGQKTISKSYERKLRCLIRKKVEVLEKEIPLLSSLFAQNIKSIFSELVNEKAVGSHALKQKENNNLTQYSNNEKAATEFSNSHHDKSHPINEKVDMHEGLVSSMNTSGKHITYEATKFSNGISSDALENGNCVETFNLGISYKYFNRYNR